MLTQEFHVGPFTITPRGRASVTHQRFQIAYGNKTDETTAEIGTQHEVAARLAGFIADWTAELRRKHESGIPVELVDADGERLALFESDSMMDMTPGLIDDRAQYWLRTTDRLYSRPVTLNEYGRLRAAHERPPLAWIADLLPEDVTTDDPDAWRAPTSWEIRHVVGEGSFVGISGAKAAALVGVNPQSMRKYTAREGAKSRQPISFAMWHLLLHRLGIQNLRSAL